MSEKNFFQLDGMKQFESAKQFPPLFTPQREDRYCILTREQSQHSVCTGTVVVHITACVCSRAVHFQKIRHE